MSDLNIARYFLQMAKLYPDAIAIIYKTKTYTFARLQKEVFGIVNALKRNNFKQNDSLLIMIPYSPALYMHILAVFIMGGNAVLVDSIRPKKNIKQAFEKARCKAVLTTPVISTLRFFLFPFKLWPKIKVLKCKNYTAVSPADKQADDPALITFTSGSTGNPKAANRTHGFLDIQLQTLIKEMQLKPGEVHLTSFPVVLMCNLAVGASSVIPSKKTINFSPDVVSASPYFFNQFYNKYNPRHWQRVFIGGALVTSQFAHETAKKTGSKQVTFVYGSTEAEPIALMSLGDYDELNKGEKGIPLGTIHPALEVCIQHTQSNTLHALKDGEIGEILVSGNHVLKNYFGDKNSFLENKIANGNQLWHRTGDAGYKKGDKLYYFGRISHCVQWQNQWVSPVVMEKFMAENRLSGEATLLCFSDKLVLFANKKVDVPMLLKLFPLTVHSVIIRSSLPKDKRHRSRIDYGKLTASIKQYKESK